MADEPWGPGKGCLDPPAVDATDAHGFGPLGNGRTGGDPGPAPVYIGGGEDTLPRKEGGDTGPGGAIAIGRGGDMVPGGRTNVGGGVRQLSLNQTNAGAPWQMRLSWMIARQGEEARMGPRHPLH